MVTFQDCDAESEDANILLAQLQNLQGYQTQCEIGMLRPTYI